MNSFQWQDGQDERYRNGQPHGRQNDRQLQQVYFIYEYKVDLALGLSTFPQYDGYEGVLQSLRFPPRGPVLKTM